MSTELIEKTFEVTTPANLTLHNIRGNVVISPHEANQIIVKATVFLDSGDPDTTTIEMNQEKDGSVSVITKYEKTYGFYINMRPCRVDYEILAPSSCSVNTKLVSSNLEINGFTGDFHLGSVSGPIIASDLTGELLIKTVSGSLTCDNLDGPARLESVSGQIKAINSNFPSLTTKTVSGMTIAHTNIGDGPYKHTSVSGSIKLIAPEDSTCSIFAKAVSGKFKTDRDATRCYIGQRKWELDFNGGGVEIRMNTVSGNMYLLSDEDSRASRPSLKRMSKEERLSILSKLEQGEINSEEALTQLQA